VPGRKGVNMKYFGYDNQFNILEIVEKYHRRSGELGVDRQAKFLGQKYKGTEMNSILEDNKVLLNEAKPYLEKLYNYVEKTGFILELIDRNGIILSIIGDKDIINFSNQIGMKVGTDMGLASTGTNAISLALEENCAIQLRGEYHYLTMFKSFTCSGAPIHDKYGNILGCINLNGWKEKVNKHTLGLVVAAADSIEHELKNKRIQKELIKSYQYAETIMNSINTGIIALDEMGKILLINDRACSMLDIDEKNSLNQYLSSFFTKDKDILSYINQHKFNNWEAVVKGNHKRVLIDSHHIIGEDQRITGSVLLLRDIKSVMKLVDKYTLTTAKYNFNQIIGESETIIRIKEYCKSIANSPSTVLIQGESGTGKELFAQAIHNYSDRRNRPFIAINCGAIPKDLIESELFGYVEGAFTGARKGGYLGKFALADKGTLFLDEIGEMPLHMQVNLLRALQEHQIMRLGDNKPIPIDVRIIAATNKNLKAEVKKGYFREDLFYRINVIPVDLPPLRERDIDLELLINHFLRSKSQLLGKNIPPLPFNIIHRLHNYHWPGNVRELENVIENIVNFNGKLNFNLIEENENHEMKKVGSSNELNTSGEVYRLPECPLKQLEKMAIEQTLRTNNYNYTKTAKFLGINRTTLYNKIKGHQINIQSIKSEGNNI
jgi:transcriptional regulator with PAS, ATPase and Fis domain